MKTIERENRFHQQLMLITVVLQSKYVLYILTQVFLGRLAAALIILLSPTYYLVIP